VVMANPSLQDIGLPDGPVAVVGAACPLGKHLVESLLEAGHPVLGLCRSAEKIPADWKKHPEFQVRMFDLGDPLSIVHALGASSNIVWLAHSREQQHAGPDVNARALDALCAQAVPGPGKIVLLSSGGTIYGNPRFLPVSEEHPCGPLSEYGRSKQTQEETLCRAAGRNANISAVVLRCGNIYGEHYLDSGGWGCIGAFARAVLAGEPLPLVAGGMAVRDFVHAEDVVRAVLLAFAHGGQFTVWNAGSGKGTRIVRVLEMVSEILERPVASLESIPEPASDVKEIVLDIGKIERECGWRPRRELREGLEATLAPLRAAASAAR